MPVMLGKEEVVVGSRRQSGEQGCVTLGGHSTSSCTQATWPLKPSPHGCSAPFKLIENVLTLSHK